MWLRFPVGLIGGARDRLADACKCYCCRQGRPVGRLPSASWLPSVLLTQQLLRKSGPFFYKVRILATFENLVDEVLRKVRISSLPALRPSFGAPKRSPEIDPKHQRINSAGCVTSRASFGGAGVRSEDVAREVEF